MSRPAAEKSTAVTSHPRSASQIALRPSPAARSTAVPGVTSERTAATVALGVVLQTVACSCAGLRVAGVPGRGVAARTGDAASPPPAGAARGWSGPAGPWRLPARRTRRPRQRGRPRSRHPWDGAGGCRRRTPRRGRETVQRPVRDHAADAASTAAPSMAQCRPIGARTLPLRSRSAQKIHAGRAGGQHHAGDGRDLGRAPVPRGDPSPARCWPPPAATRARARARQRRGDEHRRPGARPAQQRGQQHVADGDLLGQDRASGTRTSADRAASAASFRQRWSSRSPVAGNATATARTSTTAAARRRRTAARCARCGGPVPARPSPARRPGPARAAAAPPAVRRPGRGARPGGRARGRTRTRTARATSAVPRGRAGGAAPVAVTIIHLGGATSTVASDRARGPGDGGRRRQP